MPDHIAGGIDMRHFGLIGLAVDLQPAAPARVIPPGNEPVIRTIVDEALGEVELADPPGFHVDRDRIVIHLGPDHPRFVVFSPYADTDGPGVVVAPGILLVCGDPPTPSCEEGAIETWGPVGERLAAARDPHFARLWNVETHTGPVSSATVGVAARAKVNSRPSGAPGDVPM